MQVRAALEEYRYAILDYAPRTQQMNTKRIEIFVEWCEKNGVSLETLKPTDVAKFLDGLRATSSPRTKKPLSSYTVHGYAATIKAFLNWAAKGDMLPEKTPGRIPMPRIEVKIIETFTDEQVKALLRACEKEKDVSLEVRDQAIISVLLDTGIRAGELCSLTLDNVFLSPHEAYFKVYGKGSKWREVGLGKQARTILHRYITRHRRAEKEETHAFLNRHGKPLTVAGIDQMFERLNSWAQLQGVRVSAHTFRHTYAINYLKNGGDIYRLSRLMGHTSTQVTEGYLRTFKQKDARNGHSVLDTLKGGKK